MKSRSFAEFILSGAKCRFFASLRMTSEGLRMTVIMIVPEAIS